jgi:hypothetical protein
LGDVSGITTFLSAENFAACCKNFIAQAKIPAAFLFFRPDSGPRAATHFVTSIF